MAFPNSSQTKAPEPLRGALAITLAPATADVDLDFGLELTTTEEPSDSPAISPSNDSGNRLQEEISDGSVAQRDPDAAAQDPRGGIASCREGRWGWCCREGIAGIATVVALIVGMLSLLITFALHCTAVMDVVQGTTGVRGVLLVNQLVSVIVGIACVILLLFTAKAIGKITCCNHRTRMQARNRLDYIPAKGKHGLCARATRAYHLFELYTLAGGRYFRVFEFMREVFEFILQTIALKEYAEVRAVLYGVKEGRGDGGE
jgi:hypothetical protein